MRVARPGVLDAKRTEVFYGQSCDYDASSANARAPPNERVTPGARPTTVRSWSGADDGSYLVDPASSHMLVSKIKPCMSKHKPLHGEAANGSLGHP